jgi:hypothetical protein
MIVLSLGVNRSNAAGNRFPDRFGADLMHQMRD